MAFGVRDSQVLLFCLWNVFSHRRNFHQYGYYKCLAYKCLALERMRICDLQSFTRRNGTFV
jgi:hypothetical protein